MRLKSNPRLMHEFEYTIRLDEETRMRAHIQTAHKRRGVSAQQIAAPGRVLPVRAIAGAQKQKKPRPKDLGFF